MTGSFGLAAAVGFPMAAGLVSYLIGRKNKTGRDSFAALAGIAEFVLVLAIALLAGGNELTLELPGICGFGLKFTLDGFRSLYGCVAAFMWMVTLIFSREYFTHYRNRNRYYLFQLLTLGATMGVFWSADLYTTFIFFELMSFTSYVWVAQDERRESLRAAETYLGVAVIGGLVLLMGLFLLFHEIGTLDMDLIAEKAAEVENKGVLYAAGGCMLFGFGAKAGAFPLHIWLPKAHPVAPAPASALLSGILTKSGIFGIIVTTCNIFRYDESWGYLLMTIAVLTMVGGAVLALFSVDLKRTLACSSMSQIGFILVGLAMTCFLGEENALAVHGTLLHMVNHSLIKLVLFVAAGVIYMNIHALDLNEIRGFGRKKPFLNLVFLSGALGIGGIPLFNGYVSKTLIHESIVEYGGGGLFTAIEILFLFSGGLTLAYMTKLYVAIFVEKNADAKKQKKYDEMSGSYLSLVSKAVLGASAVLLPVFGVLPNQVMDSLARLGQGFFRLEEAGGQIAYFSLKNLSGAAVSLVIGAVVYLVIVRLWMTDKRSGAYLNRWPKWLDLEDNLYRPLLLTIFPAILGTACRVLDSLIDALVVLLKKTIYRERGLPHELSEGNAVTYAIGAFLNWWVRLLNATVRRKNPITVDYVHKAALWREIMSENNIIISRSVSFGLLLFCVGLFLTLCYLLFW